MIKKSISVPVAPVHIKPTFTSEMVTQCLMWDSVNILRVLEDWCEILTLDEYNGWIHSFYLLEYNLKVNEFVVLDDRFVPLLSSNSTSSKILYLLSFGTKLPILDNEVNGFMKVPIGRSGYGFIMPKNNNYHKKRDSIARIAESLIGVPYLWGGKSSFGFDCSGFVQMVFMVIGVSLPRDSSKQYKIESLKEIPFKSALVGDLIFFLDNEIVNHIGIIFDDDKIIHCSGAVKIESLIKTSVLFNSNIAKLKYVVKSISGLIDS